MYKHFKNTGVYLSLALAVCISNIANSKEQTLTWVESQINKDPEVIEARERLKASDYRAKSLT